MEKIKMVDLSGQYRTIKPEIDKAIERVLEEATFIQGPEVNDFAKSLALYLKVAHVVPCANGTDALQIALMALGLKPGDEVILPVHTYVATAEVIALLGLTPVFADVNEDTFDLNIKAIEKKITPKTKAIVPVHLYGQCADMESIINIAARHKLFVVEDTAQALGATFTFSSGEQRKAGTMGTIGTTSFFPSKNLGCFGDGGAILTNDDHIAAQLKMIANHGQKVKYHHDVVGVNSRLDTIQAAILSVKLKYLDEYTNRRVSAANYYDEHLSEINEVIIPRRSANSTHVFHQYTIKLKPGLRDILKTKLEELGIPTMIYYPVPLHLQKAYANPDYPAGSLPVSEKLSACVLSLPIHTELSTDQLDYICTSIKRILANA